MPTWKIVLIARRPNAKEWKNIGEYELPVLPRRGKHVVVSERANQPPSAYRVVGILHHAPNNGLIDVLAVYDGTPQSRRIELLYKSTELSGSESCSRRQCRE